MSRVRSLCVLLCAALAAACSEGTGPPPTITVTGVSPANGPLTGGTAVTITGTNFPTTVDSVRVGTGRLENLARVSATQLTGTTPAGSTAGAVDVTVYTTSAGRGTCAGCFTYHPVPTVASVIPNNGPLAGGTVVTITWARVPATVDSVRVGAGLLGSLVLLSDSSLKGTAPAGGTPGAVDVTVYTSSAGHGTCTGCFTYNPAPTVTSVSPANGPRAGGTAVTITGTNFPTTVDSVQVGMGRLGSLVRISATQLTGTTPASSTSGAVDVTVHSTSAGNPTCGGCFTYNPVIVVQWTNLAAGEYHTCGLASSGVAYCWGDSTTVPAAVAGGLTFASLTAGWYRTCGVTSSGGAYCWHYTTPTPVAVAGGPTFASLTVGAFHTCGLTTGGAAYCWGWNVLGQLGTTATMDRCEAPRGYFFPCSDVPVPVMGGLTFASLTAGELHTCGVTSGGAAYCWGLGTYGQLGDSSATIRGTPVAVAGGIAFATLTAGYEHTCGVTSGGAAYCWGLNRDGQLGTAATTGQCGTSDYQNPCSAVPLPVAGGLTFASLTAGEYHTCGVTTAGVAYCWGRNSSAQLGDSSTTSRTTPAAVAGGITFAGLIAGWAHTCGWTSGGAAYCWGENTWGQLGDGTTINRLTPVAVANP